MSNEKNDNQEKLKALQLTLDKIEKGYGKGTIMKMGDSAVENVAVISSGSIFYTVTFNKIYRYCWHIILKTPSISNPSDRRMFRLIQRLVLF